MNDSVCLVSQLLIGSLSRGVEGFAVRVGKRACLPHGLKSCQEPRSFSHMRLELTFQTAASCTLRVEHRFRGLQLRLILGLKSLLNAARLFGRGFGACSSAVLLFAFVCRRLHEFALDVERQPQFLDLRFESAHRFGQIGRLPSALVQFEEGGVQCDLTCRAHFFRSRIGLSDGRCGEPVDDANQFLLKGRAQAANSAVPAFAN